MPEPFDQHINEVRDLEQKLPDAAPFRPVVFYGSSSFRLWNTLADDFPDVPALNLGFGGSTTAESVHFFDRLVVPSNPRAVVFYEGDNDLGQGQTPDEVVQSFCTLHDLVQTHFGDDLPFLFIAIKPSVARWHLRDEIRETNRRICTEIAKRPRSTYVDIWPPMLGADGQPRPELFVEDGLHVNAAGYALWRDAINAHRPGNF